MSSPTSGSLSPDDAERAGDGTTPVAFGKYRLHQRIARGGMGEVYRASLVGELGFEKPLVIKTILPELAAQPRFIDLFAAEAKTAVALSHGNIVPIYELGRADDTFYIVMGYVDGPSVSQLLSAQRRRGHPPPLAVALSIVRGVLTGLAYAHTEEPGRPAVVHRDITPRNVMVDRSGQVRIVDFGIAAPASAHPSIRAGSIGYVAPEQARAEAVDPRADVFSTGCLLYELLTLERAFPSEGIWSPPDMRAVPESMREPLTLAMALDPTKRPANASAFLHSLGAAITQHAATFSETDLAAHLRTLYPDGRWIPERDTEPEGVTPATRVRPTTMTFATRPIPISAELPPPSGSSRDGEPTASDDEDASKIPSLTSGVSPAPAARRRGLVVGLALAAVAASVGTWLWLDRPPAPERLPEVAAGPTSGPAPTGADRGAGSGEAESTDSTDPTNPITPPPPDVPPTTPPPAMILHVDPETATVRIGSQHFEGHSPFTLPLPTHGSLMATVEHPGYQSQEFELRAGEPGEHTLALRPLAKGRGYLQVLAPTVSWAEVVVDGRRKGVTPLRKLDLSAGSHRLIVRCVPDVCPEPKVLLRRTIEITAGELLRVTAS
ncbi:MAG: serine/threonine protein kinase [Myxococcales bacterium]|nr:serine/threonine protein kinase [Myxococcales bacterium]